MLSDHHRQLMKELASNSIKHGLKYDQPSHVDLTSLADELIVQRATFVTLEKNGQLRGCIGMLEACRPLAEDIAENSYSAAFSDPRFPSLSEDELADLSIHISILNPAQEITCSSEAELIELLRPNIDGLILDDGIHRATFLPSVWESLPNPVDFIKHLKHKAGLPLDEWSSKIKAYRYTTESF